MTMARLMAWFIELRNRFNEPRLPKASTIYVLNRVGDLAPWQLLWHRFKFDPYDEESYMLCVSNEQNSLRENRSSTTWWLHVVETTTLRQCINYESIASIQRVMLEFLMRVCAVSLQCIVLALLFINDILYNHVSIFNREDHDFFAFVMLMIVMLKTVYVMKERRVRWEDKVCHGARSPTRFRT